MRRLAVAVAIALVALPAPAAGPACGQREAIVAELEKRYGETRRSFGLQPQGRGIVEVWASDRTGSWTILVTNTAGRTCLMAAGDAFEPEPPQPKGESL